MTLTRSLAAVLAVVFLAVTGLAAPAAAQAAGPRQSMEASLADLVVDVNAVIESGVTGVQAQAALTAAFTENGFVAKEVSSLDEAIAAGGGLSVRGRYLDVVRLYESVVCVGRLLREATSWSPGPVACADKAVALAGAAAGNAATAASSVVRNARAIAAVDARAAGKVSPEHVWQAASEARFANARKPKTLSSGKWVSRGADGTLKATGKMVFVLEAPQRLATGDTSVCKIRLVVKAGDVTTGRPSCRLA